MFMVIFAQRTNNMLLELLFPTCLREKLLEKERWEKLRAHLKLKKDVLVLYELLDKSILGIFY